MMNGKILEGTVDSQYPVGDPIWNNMGWRGFDAGLNLKSTNGWYNNGNGTDLFGFTSLPAGYRDYNGSFSDINNRTRFWTSTEHFSISSRSRHLFYSNDEIRRYFNDKSYGFSVRCLQGETTPENQPPEPASSPDPADGAEGQSIGVDLSWTCTDPEGDPLTYDIYFGTESNPSQVAIGLTETSYDPQTLENNTEYFWKIVAHDDHENTTEGPVWNFTTVENFPPEPPSTPNPENGAENQSIEIELSWTCNDPEGDPLIYDIYFGIETIPPQLATGQAETTYDLGILETNTEYFWKIVAHDDHSNTTEGPVWSFVTEVEVVPWQCSDPFTDSRDGQTYTSLQIGGQCWMGENLNIGEMINGSIDMTDNSIIEKYCYDNNTANCDEYGGLYQWNEIMQYTTTQGVQGICPADWYIPTEDDWTILTDFLGGVVIAGGKMKEAGTVHWNPPNTGANNESGFTGLPGGNRNHYASFVYLGGYGCFWSSYEVSAVHAYIRGLGYDYSYTYRGTYDKSHGLSLRCIKSDFTPVNQPPEPPSSPNPENGNTNQSIEIDLSWTCTDPEGDPLTYDVYFGIETTPPLITRGHTSTSKYLGTLEWGTTYFWRIVAHDNQGNTTEGVVWSFTTIENQPPEQPASPSPEDGAINQSTETDLSWSCTDPESDFLTYDIYFGTESPPQQIASGQTETTYDPGTMENLTQYFWKIIAHDYYENTTEGVVWSFTTEEGSVQCGDPFTDPRDGQTYITVQIGDQCWIAENLNIGEMIDGAEEMTNNGLIEKYCYDNNTSNCETYGGLYQWNETMEYTTTPGVQGICPTGWNIPTDDEWKILEGTVDSQYPVGDPIWNNTGWRGYDAGKNLKSTYGWQYGGNGSGLYAYNALPAGLRAQNAWFGGKNFQAFFWSSNVYDDDEVYAWSRHITTGIEINRDGRDKYAGLSVRCLLDDSAPVNNPPEPPANPNPESGAENQSVETDISWTCTDPEGDPLTFDIYFGTEAPLVASGQTETIYDPGTLDINTVYYWKIVAHDDHENTTEGYEWSFSTGDCGSPFTDPRNGQTYNTVQIGNQCWMAENLNIGTMINGNLIMTNNGVIEKYCYDNNTVNCDEYGGLYLCDEMMEYTTTPGTKGICPSGWHLPEDEEWTILTDYLGGTFSAGGKMKETGTSHWLSPNAGATNESGFTALPGGNRDIDWDFGYLTLAGRFWKSSTEFKSEYVLCLYLGYNSPYVEH